jgi:hypothetical protein
MGNIEFKIDSKNDSKFDSKNDSKLHIRPLSCIYVEYAISTWNEIAHIHVRHLMRIILADFLLYLNQLNDCKDYILEPDCQ